MKSTFALAVLAITALIGCDPGMVVRQSDTAAPPEERGLTIRVKTAHEFIGRTSFVPTVQVTNSTNTPITITSVELAARQAVLPNKPIRSTSYPLVVEPNKSDTLDVWFNLPDSAYKVFFRQSAELRVHYVQEGREGIARTGIVGESLSER